MEEGRKKKMRALGSSKAETTEILGAEEQGAWHEESLRLRNEIAKEIGFTVVEEVILIHTDEIIA